jgi:thiamine transport system permease protein
MDRRLGTTGRQRLSAGRVAFPLAAVATLSVLVVAFYYPVGTVLVAGLSAGEGLTLGPVVDVLRDPFYVGALATLFSEPAAVPAGLAAWARAGFPPVEFGLFGFTAWQALLSTVASVVVGLPGAYVLARYEFRGRELLRSLTVVPFVLPGVLVALGFLVTFGRNGTLNAALGPLVGVAEATGAAAALTALAGLVGHADTVRGFYPVDLMFTLEIIVLAHAFYNAPLVVRLVAAAWEGVDARDAEAARTLGASRLRAFRDVVLPRLLPALGTAALLTFVFTFMSFPIVLALGGLRFATVEVWLYARVQSLDLAEAAGLATLETAVTLTLTYLYLRYEARASTSAAANPIPRRPLVSDVRALVRPERLAVVVYGVGVLALFVAPLASVVAAGLATADGVGLANYAFLVGTERGSADPVTAVRNSLVFAAAAVAVAVPMGVVVAVATTRAFPGRKAADALLMAPLAVSGVVVGLGLLEGLVFGVELFGRRVVVGGPLAVVAAHAVAGYPFVVRNVAPALDGVDRRLVESARVLGASRLRALLDVELPLVAPGLVAGAAFAVAISIGEFDSTVILATGGQGYTMPVALERYLTNRSLGPDIGPAAAMGTVLLAVSALSFVVVDRLGGRWGAGP